MRAWLVRNQFIVLALTLLISFVGLVYVGPNEPRPLEIGYDSSLPDGAPIKIHIAGAIARPGVYELHEGDRVADAVGMAGGATENAELEGLNLARRARDGEQILVPARTSRAEAVATLVPGTRLDINTATLQQLDQLPGIGEAYSRRIVDSRRADGPYKTVDELVQRRVLPQALLELVRGLIEVR